MKAVLVFCEGRSDIAFVRRSLVAIAECEEFSGRIRDLPAPFGTIRTIKSERSIASKGLIARHIDECFNNKSADDQKLAGAVSIPTPQIDSIVLSKERNVIYLFINAGGRDQHKKAIEMLGKVESSIRFIYKMQIESSKDWNVTEYSTAFLFDANDRGKENTIQQFHNNYCDYFSCSLPSDHAVWIRSDKCPVGIFICCGEDGKGATENYIIRMISSAFSERYQGACKFINENRKGSDKVSKSKVNTLKAIITTVGQFSFPGDSFLSLIRDKGSGIPDEQFKNLDACKDLVKFLQDIPWED